MRTERDAIRSAVAAAQAGTNGDGGPIVVLDHEDRAHEGSPEITTWCPTCEENAVPMRDGTCGFCDTQLADPAEALPEEAWPHTNGSVRRQTAAVAGDERRMGQVKRAREAVPAQGPILARPRQDGPDDTTDDTTAEPDDALLDQERTRIDPTQAPILDWLELHGVGTASQIAEKLNRKPGNVSTRLRQYEQQGYVRRTGRSIPGGQGGPQIEWELSDPDKEPTSTSDVISTPLSPPVSDERAEMRRRYFDALLALVSRDCPDHIYERIERIAGIS